VLAGRVEAAAYAHVGLPLFASRAQWLPCFATAFGITLAPHWECFPALTLRNDSPKTPSENRNDYAQDLHSKCQSRRS
jgi:hypothetical protein